MSALEQALIRQIKATGPITVAEYMNTCLLHPEHGYYTTRDPLGAAGDFTTAPEISQMFGELVGLSLAQSWRDQGAPARFTLAELGPGRGTLMADALRAAQAVPGFLDAADLVLIEASAPLRAAQCARLPNARHLDSVADLPDAPLFLIANEFFDALPVRQFLRKGDGWSERQVGVVDDALAFGLSAAAPVAALAHRLNNTSEGDLVETCTPALPIIDTISRRIRDHGGAALVIDYGSWRSKGDTLQALRAHQKVPPLSAPGTADLTAHVDFEALAAAALCAHTRPTAQGVWLERLGITPRAQALARHLSGDALEAHIAAHRRLTHPAEMGNLFQVMGLFPSHAAAPPGLDT